MLFLRENPRSRESLPNKAADSSAINRSTISEGDMSSHSFSARASRRGHNDHFEDEELRAAEADLKLARSDMLNQLDEFKMERNFLRKMQAERNMEQKMSTRFIKHEVAEINDKVEWMQERIVSQQHLLHTILRRLDGGDYEDDGEDGESSDDSQDRGHQDGHHHHHKGEGSDSFGTDEEGDSDGGDSKEGEQQPGKRGGGAPKQHGLNLGDQGSLNSKGSNREESALDGFSNSMQHSTGKATTQKSHSKKRSPASRKTRERTEPEASDRSNSASIESVKPKRKKGSKKQTSMVSERVRGRNSSTLLGVNIARRAPLYMQKIRRSFRPSIKSRPTATGYAPEIVSPRKVEDAHVDPLLEEGQSAGVYKISQYLDNQGNPTNIEILGQGGAEPASLAHQRQQLSNSKKTSPSIETKFRSRYQNQAEMYFAKKETLQKPLLAEQPTNHSDDFSAGGR